MKSSLVALVSGTIFWGFTMAGAAVREPWDAPGFGYIYLIGLALCAAIGAIFPQGAVWAGALFILAQMPVMLVSSGIGSMIVPGLVLLAIMAVPGALAGLGGAKLARSWR